LRRKEQGVYLEGGPIGDILLPNRYVPEGTKVGDILDVFLYLDQDERLIATTEHPYIEVGQFAYLECAWVNDYGAYLNWGLMKDLFCPFREQKVRMQRGQRYLVYCYIDDKTYRIVCSSKIEKFQKAISEQAADEQRQEPRRQNRFEPRDTPADRRVIIGDFSRRLLQHLRDTEKGSLPFHDKTPSDEIYNKFGVSKKVFKQALGDLYKQDLISLHANGIELTVKGKTSGVED
jgi:predicted RNA-binding protein (virulence factor B family)